MYEYLWSLGPAGFNRVFLALFFSFVAIFYTSLIMFRSRRHQCRCVHKGNRWSLHWLNHLAFRMFRALIWGVCVVRVFWPEIDVGLGVLSDEPILLLFGDSLLCFGFALAVYSTVVMNGSWRSGIDTVAKAQLITRKVFRFSRNPNFIGVMLAQLGFFFALPSIFSLICLFVGWTAIHIQVRLEEKHLAASFKKDYLDYQNSTPRWLY